MKADNIVTFVNTANRCYAAEIEGLLYEGSGQGRLVFVNTNVFEAFVNIECTQTENFEEIKRGIARAFGKAVLAIIEIYLSGKYLVDINSKISEQIYYGQFNNRKDKVHFWVEVTAFYILDNTPVAFSYKLNIDNRNARNEQYISKTIKDIEKSVDKQARVK